MLGRRKPNSIEDEHRLAGSSCRPKQTAGKQNGRISYLRFPLVSRPLLPEPFGGEANRRTDYGYTFQHSTFRHQR